jgi:KRAB domain-containing zinc finger protein
MVFICFNFQTEESSRCFCFYCGAIFSNHLSRISHHLETHTTFSCNFCPLIFTRKDIRDKHHFVHDEAKLFKCEKCGKGFKQKYNLQVHSSTVCAEDEGQGQAEMNAKRRELYRKFREKEKKYKCSTCSKAFVELRRLEDHKKRVHSSFNE